MEMNDYEVKEELIKQAKELAESEDLAGVFSKAKALRRRWRNGDEDSMYDKELADKFYGYLDVISAKEGEALAFVEDKKKEIIAKAKETLGVKNFKKATSVMNELMDEWKAAGSLPKEKNDELWGEFKAVRDEFFANKKQYFDALRETFENNKSAKEVIIEAAKKANELTNFKEIGTIMNDLMEQWKKTGSAGKDNDDNLWKSFQQERQSFYNKRNEYFNELKETYAKRVEAKKEIIAKAKRCLALSEFTEDEIATVKGLRAAWKEVGNAGKENEESLYSEFNDLLNRYFDNMKYYK